MKCPHCEWPFNYDELHAWFVAHDHATDFEHDCTQCTQAIAIRVVALPEFDLTKPEKDPDPA